MAMKKPNNLTPAEIKKIQDVFNDPVKWSQIALITYDGALKKDTPWTARWYQVEMLRDKSLKKVYRCGRRTGKTETMVVDMLHKIFTNKNYRCLTITPYENQVRLQFQRIKELVDSSPLLKAEVVSMTKNPYQITLRNNSAIFGFTTGATSGNGGASVRGQRADWLYFDEIDYMGEKDYDAVAAIAMERNDIGITASSTPTGKRGQFWKMCNIEAMHFSQHYHPSMHNPNWCESMEAEFRAQLSENGYVHEVLAEFGEEEMGVFNKDKIDKAMEYEYYAYNELDYYQKIRCKDNGIQPKMYLYPKGKRAFTNPWRTIGVDFDKYGASSSILILDYDIITDKFKVIKRVEVPKSEYSYDTAVNLIIELNEQYNPAWIYCDAGSGEYQLERLHIYGDEHPSTGLKNKVKRWQFKQTIDITDPITFETHKEPMKPFMVNQLAIAFERERMILSPFDEVLHKQLIDYSVDRIAQNGQPIFTSDNEHFVDALGLAYLAMVLEFKELTNMMKEPETATKIAYTPKKVNASGLNSVFNDLKCDVRNYNNSQSFNIDTSDRRGDRQSLFKVDMGYRSRRKVSSWGDRNIRSNSNSFNRSSW